MSKDQAQTSPLRDPRGAADAEKWYRELYPLLIRQFLRWEADLELARDLAQETVLAAWKSRGSFKGESKLSTWMVSIAKNIWAQHWRERKRIKRDAEEVALDTPGAESSSHPRPWSPPTPSPEETAADRDLLARAAETLRSLSPERREAMQLWVQGYSYREIAVLLGVTVSRVSSLLHEARKELKRSIDWPPVDSAS